MQVSLAEQNPHFLLDGTVNSFAYGIVKPFCISLYYIILLKLGDFDMIIMTENLFFGKGSHKKCYRHPLDRDKCITFPYTEDGKKI